MKAKVAAATRLQKVWRKYAWMKKLSIVKAKVKGSLRGIRTVQRLFRVGKEYKHFQRIRRSTRKIQRSIRRKLARRKMIKLKTMVFKLQAWWKKVFLQRRFRRQKSAAMFINRVWRGGIARGIQRRVKYIQTIMLVLSEAQAGPYLAIGLAKSRNKLDLCSNGRKSSGADPAYLARSPSQS